MITLIRSADSAREKETIIIQQRPQAVNESEVLDGEAQLLFDVLYRSVPDWTFRKLSKLFKEWEAGKWTR